MTSDDPITTIQVMTVQLDRYQHQSTFKERIYHLLTSVEPDISIGSEDGSDRNGRSEICKRIHVLAIPGYRQTEIPYAERKEVHHCGLIETIEHVHPKLCLCVIESTNSAQV